MMVLFDIPSGTESFKAEIILSGASNDRSVYIRVGHASLGLETLSIAYPSSNTSTTLVNIRPDDLEMTTRRLASRLSQKFERPVLLSLEMLSPQDTPVESWSKHLSDIEAALIGYLKNL